MRIRCGIAVALASAAGAVGAPRGACAADSDPTWVAFLEQFREAGRASVAKAKETLERQRPRLVRAGLENAVAPVDEVLRGATFVHASLIEGLRTARGFVRFTSGAQPVSGKVTEVAGGVVRLRSSLGKTHELALDELSAKDLVLAAAVLRYGLASPLQVADYYLVRGEYDEARTLIDGSDDVVGRDRRRALLEVLGGSPASAEKEPPATGATGEMHLAVAEPASVGKQASAQAAGPRVPATGGPYEADEHTALLLHFDEAEGAVLDSSNGEVVALETKDAVRTGAREGLYGSAMAFNGTTSCVTMSSQGELSVEGEKITVEAWVRQRDRHAGANPVQYVVFQGVGAGYHLGLRMGNAFFAIVTAERGRIALGEQEEDGTQVPLNTWTHVAGTYDGASMKIFIDGELRVTRRFMAGALGFPPSEVMVGNLFSGQIDEVRVSSVVREFRGVGRGRSPEEQGCLLDLAVIQTVAARYDPRRVSEKKIATVGGAVAAHAGFDAPAEKELRRAQGYVFSDKGAVAGSRKTIESAEPQLEDYLTKDAPEVVRICFGPNDIARGKTSAELRPQLARLAELVLERGAIPIMYTLPMPILGVEKGGGVVREYNEMVVGLARSMRVPCIDAMQVLNDPTKPGGHFLPNGSPTPEGYEVLGAKFIEVYRGLEYWVMGRGERPAEPELRVVELPPIPEPGPRGVAAGAPRRGRPGEASAEGRPPKPKEDEPPPPPVGNQVANGGFEMLDPQTRFASGWSAHQWGPQGARHSVRVDGTEPHSGERSLCLRQVTEGSLGGAFTSVSLPPGKYELRFWALADVDEGQTASVSSHLAGTDFDPVEVGPKWRRFVQVAELYETQITASVRLWSSTVRVRTWIDDVEVEALLPAEPSAEQGEPGKAID